MPVIRHEGFLRLDRLPTAAEGEIIRQVLGIHKRRPPPAAGFKKIHQIGQERSEDSQVDSPGTN
jgi:hypothetical protein